MLMKKAESRMPLLSSGQPPGSKKAFRIQKLPEGRFLALLRHCKIPRQVPHQFPYSMVFFHGRSCENIDKRSLRAGKRSVKIAIPQKTIHGIPKCFCLLMERYAQIRLSCPFRHTGNGHGVAIQVGVQRGAQSGPADRKLHSIPVII